MTMAAIEGALATLCSHRPLAADLPTSVLGSRRSEKLGFRERDRIIEAMEAVVAFELRARRLSRDSAWGRTRHQWGDMARELLVRNNEREQFALAGALAIKLMDMGRESGATVGDEVSVLKRVDEVYRRRLLISRKTRLSRQIIRRS